MNATQAIVSVLAKAKSYDYVRELPPHLNRGKEIDAWNKAVGNDVAAPWCAAFEWGVGHEGCGDAYPVVKSGGCEDIHDWGARKKVLEEQAGYGDLMLVYHASLKRWAHVGFVSGLVAGGFTTIEGNTNPAGGREGYGVFARTHLVTLPSPTLIFVRWASLLPEQ